MLYCVVNDSCTLNYCGTNRPFSMKLKDSKGGEIMEFNRPYRCDCCCCPCCLQELEVQAPVDTVIGKIKQGWSLGGPQLKVTDEKGETQFIIKGPCCTASCCGHIEFPVYSAKGNQRIGIITREVSTF